MLCTHGGERADKATVSFSSFLWLPGPELRDYEAWPANIFLLIEPPHWPVSHQT